MSELSKEFSNRHLIKILVSNFGKVFYLCPFSTSQSSYCLLLEMTELAFAKCWFKTWCKRGFKILSGNLIDFFFKTIVTGILFKTRRRFFSYSINSQSRDWSSVNYEVKVEFESCVISFLGTLRFSENKFLQKSKSSWWILWWNARLLLPFVIFQIALCAALDFSRLRKILKTIHYIRTNSYQPCCFYTINFLYIYFI